MADVKWAYPAGAAYTITLNSLGSGAYVTGAEIDNTTNLYLDVLLSGAIKTGATAVAGEVIEIFVSGQYDTGTGSDWGGGLGTNFNPTLGEADETEGTGIVLVNTQRVGTITVGAINALHHFGPWGIARRFGGWLPPAWNVIVKWAGTDPLGTGHSIGYQGMKTEDA